MQRQYVETVTALLVVVTSTDLQNGQAFGATTASVDWVYTRITCALFTEHRNLVSGNQRIAQHGSVPQTGGHA